MNSITIRSRTNGNLNRCWNNIIFHVSSHVMPCHNQRLELTACTSWIHGWIDCRFCLLFTQGNEKRWSFLNYKAQDNRSMQYFVSSLIITDHATQTEAKKMKKEGWIRLISCEEIIRLSLPPNSFGFRQFFLDSIMNGCLDCLASHGITSHVYCKRIISDFWY